MANITENDERPDARIDGPHAVRKSAAAKRKVVVAAAFADVDDRQGLDLLAMNPIEGQAADLADRLARQQADLDRRAALLDSQEADLESKLRAARMWIDEQRRELEDREAAIEAAGKAPDPPQKTPPDSKPHNSARETQLREREEWLAEQKEHLARRERELQVWQGKLDQQRDELEEASAGVNGRELQLVIRQQEIETALKRFERLGVSEQRMAKLQEEQAQFAARTRYLDEAEALLAENQTKLAAERQSLDTLRREQDAEILRSRQALHADAAKQQTEIKLQSEQLSRREAELEQRAESLDRMHFELQTTQREVLEMRLATEETWAQLTGVLAPTTLTRSIAQVRAKLADQYQQMLADMTERRTELRTAANEVSTQYEQLRKHRDELQAWAERRNQDFSELATRLVAREQELDRQQVHYERLESRWQAERDELQEEIRGLLAELRREPLATAA
jgi:hypothetical protein